MSEFGITIEKIQALTSVKKIIWTEHVAGRIRECGIKKVRFTRMYKER